MAMEYYTITILQYYTVAAQIELIARYICSGKWYGNIVLLFILVQINENPQNHISYMFVV